MLTGWTWRALQLQEITTLKTEIDRGLIGLAEGRPQDFDADRIIERGRVLLAGRFRSRHVPQSLAICFVPKPEAIMIVRVIHGAHDVVAIAGRSGFA